MMVKRELHHKAKFSTSNIVLVLCLYFSHKLSTLLVMITDIMVTFFKNEIVGTSEQNADDAR